jgi:hypothetical protein
MAGLGGRLSFMLKNLLMEIQHTLCSLLVSQKRGVLGICKKKIGPANLAA